jgi:uncharacterized protein
VWVGRHPLAAFLLVCFGLAWVRLLLLAVDPPAWFPVNIQPRLAPLANLVPVLAALGVSAATGRGGDLLARVSLWRFGLGWYAVALLGPGVLYALAITLDTPSGGPPLTLPSLLALVHGAMLTVALGLLAGSQEIGWRGFLLPRLLEHLSALEAGLVLGAVWAAWHLLLVGWVIQPSANMPLPAFTVFALASSVVLTWLYARTGSALPAVLLQCASVTVQSLLLVAPGNTRPFELYAGLCALVALLLVFTGSLPTGPVASDSGHAGE